MTPISRINGIVQRVGKGWVDVSLGSLSFRLTVLGASLPKLTAGVGSPVDLHTVLIVNESEIFMYGFLDEQERDVFEMLLEVKGIGPRLALATLAELRPEDVLDAGLQNKVTVLTKVSGIGEQTAKRIVSKARAF